MPGMGRSLQTGNSLIVSAFHTELLHQLLLILLVGALCAIGFNIIRTVQYRRLKQHGQDSFPTAPRFSTPEATARRVLRIGFGCLWILDGLLQLQLAMPLGLPSGVIQPAASTSPGWVQHLVNSGLSIWTDHPIQASSATVWIQVGLGLWLLVAPRGRWSRPAASPAWAGGSWSGRSGKPSAGFSPPGRRGSSEHPGPSSSTAPPASSSPCPNGPSPHRASAGSSSPPAACS